MLLMMQNLSNQDILDVIAKIIKASKDAIAIHPNIPLQNNIVFEENVNINSL